MADLRESGGIEANASGIILLHRPDYYEKESPRAGEADAIVAKNRMGSTSPPPWPSRATTPASST